MTTPPDRIAELIARQPAEHALLRPFYCDPLIFEQDLERAILPYWLFVGHEARLPQAGDFFRTSIASESILITRGDNGEIHALLNVCRHRGSRICLSAEGRARRLVCPYHAWVYAADGKLLTARRMPETFDKTEHGLRSFPVRMIEGLIFINLSNTPVSFDATIHDGTRYLRPHGFQRAKIAARQTWNVQANWKLVMENFRECYHCPPAHPEYCAVMAHGMNDDLDQRTMSPASVEFVNHWYAQDAVRQRPPVQSSRQGEHWHLCGRYPIREGFVTQSQDGRPLSPLMGDLSEYDGGVTTLSVYPLHFTTACCDHATLFRFTPLDVQRTEVELTWLVDQDAQEGRDYDITKVTWLWRLTTEQDKTIVDNNQAGVNSRFYTPGPYGDEEPDVKQFIRWYLDRIASRPLTA